MEVQRSRRNPLEAFAESAGDGIVEAFKALGNETRLAILLALWQADDEPSPSSDITSLTLPFSELQERVGMADSGRFAYHLNQLVGSFVERTDDGYHLMYRALQLIGVMLSGWYREDVTFEDEPTDETCPLCGGPVVADFRDGILLDRCTVCPGLIDEPSLPEGTLSWSPRSPAGLAGRSPADFIRSTEILLRHQYECLAEGVCPICSGHVEVSARVCDDHDVADGPPCPRCHRADPVGWIFTCAVCRMILETSVHFPPTYTDPDVLGFFHDHGVDARRVDGTDAAQVYRTSLEDVRVLRRDPLHVRLAWVLDGDRLEVVLGEDARAAAVKRTDG